VGECVRILEKAKRGPDIRLATHALLTLARFGGFVSCGPNPALLAYDWILRVHANESAAVARAIARLRPCANAMVSPVSQSHSRMALQAPWGHEHWAPKRQKAASWRSPTLGRTEFLRAVSRCPNPMTRAGDRRPAPEASDRAVVLWGRLQRILHKRRRENAQNSFG
jgi:hypothetical protein